MIEYTDRVMAPMAGGYRDVQLSVVLSTEETRRRHLDLHICEVQLHLAAFAYLKSNGGHRSYVVARNLRGE